MVFKLPENVDLRPGVINHIDFDLHEAMDFPLPIFVTKEQILSGEIDMENLERRMIAGECSLSVTVELDMPG